MPEGQARTPFNCVRTYVRPYVRTYVRTSPRSNLDPYTFIKQLSVCEVPEDVSLFEKISKDVYKANYKVSEVDALCGSEFVWIIKDLE